MDLQQASQIVDAGLSAFTGNRAQHIELQSAYAVVMRYAEMGQTSEQIAVQTQSNEVATQAAELSDDSDVKDPGVPGTNGGSETESSEDQDQTEAPQQ